MAKTVAEIQAELAAATAAALQSRVVIPEIVLTIPASDGRGGWSPEQPRAKEQPVIVEAIKKSKFSSPKVDDVRFVQKYGDGMQLKAYASTLKGAWRDCGQDPGSLFSKVGDEIVMNDRFEIEWVKNEGTDSEQYPTKMVAHAR